MKLKNRFELKRFFSLDIRWKIKRVSKKIGINFYPKYFKFKGIQNFYNRIIFNLIFYEKVFKKKKEIYHNISKITQPSNTKINFIFSPPCSGSNYVRNFFSSYLELRYKIGNGIPKFDNYSDNRWMFSDTPIIKADLFNNIVLEESYKKDRWDFYDKETFLKERIGMSRYPLQGLELFKINDLKPIILIRDPSDWLVSMYLNKYKRNPFYKKFTIENQVNLKLIKDSSHQYVKFTKFWCDYLKDKNKNEYLLINFSDLINHPEKKFLQIINHFNITLDNDNLNKSIHYNSKEFTLSNLKGDFKGTRFSNPEKNQNITKLIQKDINEIIEKNNLKEFFKLLINI